MAETRGEPSAPADDAPSPPVWPGWAVAIAICVRFYSRLPVPALQGETTLHGAPDFRTVPRALPFAALVIALPATLTLAGLGAAGCGAMLAAALALAVSALVTGAFHEDGLADSADGLFGGYTPERRLEIMRDSRVGSYGALALVFSVLLRASALAAILETAGAGAAAAALLVAAPWSRAEGLQLLASEPPARRDGASASVGRPSRETAWIALALALVLALGIGRLVGLPWTGLLLGLALSHLAVRGLARLARRLIGGQTGDILGAAQQLAEIALYFGLALMLRPGA